VVDADWTSLNPLAPAPGHLLVATPVLGEPTFRRTVIYLLEHHAEGTLGVVLNRPSRTSVAEALPSWRDVVTSPGMVFEGGPVQRDGALCLGAVETEAPRVSKLHDGIASVDLDGDADDVVGVASALRIFVGYAGWSAGQLDDELVEGAWWVVPGSRSDLFSDEPEQLWSRVLRRQRPPLAFFATYPDDPERN
jgi:putative transcriptional regulator